MANNGINRRTPVGTSSIRVSLTQSHYRVRHVLGEKKYPIHSDDCNKMLTQIHLLQLLKLLSS